MQLTWYYWCIKLLLLAPQASAQGQPKKIAIEAYNCFQPTNIRKYQREEACQTPQEDKPAMQMRTLVQATHIQRVQGYSCLVMRSTFRYKCGAWSHLKVAMTPEIEHMSTVSAEWCHTMAIQRKFKIPESSSYPIELNKINLISLVTIGSLTEESDSIVCRGQPIHYRGSLHTNVVQQEEYKVIIRREQFKVQNNIIETETSHLKLPCSPEAGSCITGQATFIYDRPVTNCPLKRIRNIQAMQVLTTYLLDENHRLLINQSDVSHMRNCDFAITKTQVKDIYLVNEEDGRQLAEISPEDIEVDAEIKFGLDFLAYYTEQKVLRNLQDQNMEKEEEV